jgi:hypothetical protein
LFEAAEGSLDFLLVGMANPTCSVLQSIRLVSGTVRSDDDRRAAATRGGIKFELHPPAVSSESPAPNLAANLGVGGQNSVRRRINELRHISFSAVPVFFRQNGGVTRYNFVTSPLKHRTSFQQRLRNLLKRNVDQPEAVLTTTLRRATANVAAESSTLPAPYTKPSRARFTPPRSAPPIWRSYWDLRCSPARNTS